MKKFALLFITLYFSPAFFSRILNFGKLLYWSNVYEKVKFCRVLKIKVWQPKAVHCLVIRIDYLGYINMQSVRNTVYVFTGHFSKFFLFTLSKFVKIVWIIFAKYHKALFLRYFLFGQIKKSWKPDQKMFVCLEMKGSSSDCL